jgi:hypothetical protein
MSFKEDVPDYKTYSNDDYYHTSIPSELNGAICGLASRSNTNELKIICNEISALIPCEPTKNWGLDFLRNDFDDFLWKLSKKFCKYMDFLEWLVSDFCNYSDNGINIDDLNDVLEEHNLGYVLTKTGRSSYCWMLRSDVIPTSKPLIEAKEEIKDICLQAADHLRKSLEHLQNVDDERARKDAVRDAVSAMESVIKKLSNTEDIKEGVKYLRGNTHLWGNEFIVKDGISIWQDIHRFYPDIRHGNPQSTTLSKSESLYWIERCICYISYLQRKQRDI